MSIRGKLKVGVVLPTTYVKTRTHKTSIPKKHVKKMSIKKTKQYR